MWVNAQTILQRRETVAEMVFGIIPLGPDAGLRGRNESIALQSLLDSQHAVIVDKVGDSHRSQVASTFKDNKS